MAVKSKRKKSILKKRKAVPEKRKVLARKPKVRKLTKIKSAKRRKALSIRSKVKSQRSKVKRVAKRTKKVKKVAKKPKKTDKKIVRKKPVARKKIKSRKITKKHFIRKPKKKIKKAEITRRHRAVKRIKKSVSRKLKKQIAANPTETFSAEALFKAKIKVIGVGGGGGSIVSEIGRSLDKATFVIADTDIRALKKKSGIKYLWFGQELTHGLGTGVNVDLAKQAAEAAKEKISDYFKDQDIIIFVASLGGGLGSGATQVFAEAAREFGGITFGIFTMPFKFEGKNKQRIAQSALKALRQSLNVSLVIPNEKIFKVIDEATPITTAFSTVNKSLIESLESLIDLIYNPGIINIDFADLRTILRGRGNSAFLNTVEESGKNRVEKICENIFKNPLLQSSGFETERILFNISGAENLSMFEVEKISSHIANLNPKAKIIFGISKNSKLKNKIKTTILMTGLSAGIQVKEETQKKPDELPQKKPVAQEKSKLQEDKAQKPVEKNQKKTRKKTGSKAHSSSKDQKQVSSIPVFEVTTLDQAVAGVGQRMEVNKGEPDTGKKAIRRSALEIKKAEELQEKKRIDQEKEWETPAFLRRIKFKER